MARRRLCVGVLVVGALLALSACAAGANDVAGTGAQDAGFWLGLWHGAISPLTFVISLFTPTVSIYEIHNVGGWYDAGFMLGLSVVFSGGARSGSAATRRRA